MIWLWVLLIPYGWDDSLSQDAQHEEIRSAYRLHGKPEIPVGKSNGTHHSIWSTSEIMGFWSKWYIFITPFGIYSWCSYILHVIHLLLRQGEHFVVMPKISIRVVCVNGKHPRSITHFPPHGVLVHYWVNPYCLTRLSLNINLPTKHP